MTIRILISHDANLEILTEDTKNKLISKNKYKQSNITRYHYYSQIKQDNDIYTENYKLLDTKTINNFNIYITEYTTEQQDQLSFPNLNTYHLIENISQYVINNKDHKIIIENNKLIIEFEKLLDYDYIYNLITNYI